MDLIKIDNALVKYGGLMGRPPKTYTWLYLIPLILMGFCGNALFNAFVEPPKPVVEMVFLDLGCLKPDTVVGAVEITKAPVKKTIKKGPKAVKVSKKSKAPTNLPDASGLRERIVKDLEGWNPEMRIFSKKTGKKRKFDDIQNWVITKKEMMEMVPDMIVDEIIYGIPAAITIAQVDVEAKWFKSNLALKTNNGFGIKHCKRWDRNPDLWMREYRDGHETAHDDLPTDKFIKFKSKWASIRFHTKFLYHLQYKALLKGEYSFDKWARGLKRYGYATHPDYVETLKSRYTLLDLSFIEKVAKKYKNEIKQKNKGRPVSPPNTGNP